jgi:dGTP triphosphohydrolase
VREDAVAHFLGEIQPLGDEQRLLVVAKVTAESIVQRSIERVLARVPERRMSEVMSERVTDYVSGMTDRFALAWH